MMELLHTCVRRDHVTIPAKGAAGKGNKSEEDINLQQIYNDWLTQRGDGDLVELAEMQQKAGSRPAGKASKPAAGGKRSGASGAHAAASSKRVKAVSKPADGAAPLAQAQPAPALLPAQPAQAVLPAQPAQPAQRHPAQQAAAAQPAQLVATATLPTAGTAAPALGGTMPLEKPGMLQASAAGMVAHATVGLTTQLMPAAQHPVQQAAPQAAAPPREPAEPAMSERSEEYSPTPQKVQRRRLRQQRKTARLPDLPDLPDLEGQAPDLAGLPDLPADLADLLDLPLDLPPPVAEDGQQADLGHAINGPAAAANNTTANVVAEAVVHGKAGPQQRRSQRRQVQQQQQQQQQEQQQEQQRAQLEQQPEGVAGSGQGGLAATSPAASPLAEEALLDTAVAKLLNAGRHRNTWLRDPCVPGPALVKLPAGMAASTAAMAIAPAAADPQAGRALWLQQQRLGAQGLLRLWIARLMLNMY